MTRLTWSKQPNERGLARVCQGPRGAVLKADGQEVARVAPVRGRHRFEAAGWYWYAATNTELGIAHGDTSSKPVDTIDEAKAQAETYIRACLGMPPAKRKAPR